MVQEDKIVKDGQENQPETARRKVLTGMASGYLASASGLIGFAGSSKAVAETSEERKQEVKNAAAEYNTAEAVRSAVDSQATAILKELSRRDIMLSPTAAALNITEINAANYTEEDEGIHVSGVIKDDTPSASVLIKRRFDGQKVLFVLHPQVSEAHAIIYPGDGSSTSEPVSIVTAETTNSQVSANSGVTTTGCFAASDICRYACPDGQTCRCVKQDMYCCDGECNPGDIHCSRCCHCEGCSEFYSPCMCFEC